MTKKKSSKKAQSPALHKGVVSRSYCPQPRVKPINISFDGLTGESGISLNPEVYFNATIMVSFRIDKSAVEKYIGRELSIKDLNDMIEGRK